MCVNLNIEFLQLITSIATVIIAVTAIFLTFRQLQITREHNHKSVKPLLSFERHIDRIDYGFGIYLNNNGLGPAIVIDMCFFLDGKEITKINSGPWINILKKLNLNFSFIQTGYFDEDTVIAPGERKGLFFVDEELSTDQEKRFKEAIPKIEIEIKYKSIYNIKDSTKLIPIE